MNKCILSFNTSHDYNPLDCLPLASVHYLQWIRLFVQKSERDFEAEEIRIPAGLNRRKEFGIEIRDGSWGRLQIWECPCTNCVIPDCKQN